jgi:hypothetical protein
MLCTSTNNNPLPEDTATLQALQVQLESAPTLDAAIEMLYVHRLKSQ